MGIFCVYSFTNWCRAAYLKQAFGASVLPDGSVPPGPCPPNGFWKSACWSHLLSGWLFHRIQINSKENSNIWQRNKKFTLFISRIYAEYHIFNSFELQIVVFSYFGNEYLLTIYLSLLVELAEWHSLPSN